MLAVAGLAVLLLAGAWIATVLLFTRRRLGLGAELRDALASGAIEAEYQPIVTLADGRCVGAEALARWRGPEGEVIPPEEFLPIAEHAGLVPEITLAVLDALLRELGDLLAARPDLRINLNLAPEDLETPRFADALAERMRNAGVPPATIKLEITERALVDSDRARELIERLRRQGHEIAIDDFGTGYSSLSYLETFSLDTLKIDKAFVDAIETEAVTSHVVHHVIAMAKDLRLDIVAEGVEREAQAAWLRERGVRHAQGFLFSEPLTPERFHAWLEGADSAPHAAASA
jgi:sensor c-di-GMP phosphodiesterase-like protein